MDKLGFSLAPLQPLLQGLATPLLWLQLSFCGVCLIVGHLLSRGIVQRLDRVHFEYNSRWFNPLVTASRSIVAPLLGALFLYAYLISANRYALPTQIVDVFLNLLAAWIVIRFTSFLVRDAQLARWIAVVAWIIAALNILGILPDVIAALDHIGFTVGKTRVTLLALFKGLATFGLLLWAANALAGLAERQIYHWHKLTPSLQVLLGKTMRTVLILFAFLVGLNMLGLDLTSLALFSGAVGVGLGFGLQKVVSNFISGIILLMDRSIKPGDVIAIGDTYGWVNTLSARHVSVITRDGKEHLIPNESLITEKVENWSYSDANVRLRLNLSITYGSDVRKALQTMIDAAKECRRVLRAPEPNALITGFSENGVQLELRVWINDPTNGVGNIRSEIFLRIWDKFHEQGISFPFPQRDIHVQSGKPLQVELLKGK